MNDARPFEILPAIDLRGGRVVRLRRGDFSRETAYGDDPVEVARGFAGAGARWLHVVDLDGAREGRPVQGAATRAILAAIGHGTRVEIAGGLRTAGAVADVLAAGAARAVIGTAALDNQALARALVATYGPDRIVAAIDVRAGRAVGQGWSGSAAGLEVERAIDELLDSGLRWFEVTAIERDGVLEGPDVALYERLLRLVTPGPGHIIASGGIASLDDLRTVGQLGASGAIVGRALYEGRFSLGDALALA